MSDPLRTLPVAFDRAERLAKLGGGAALVVTLIFGAMNLDQLLRSYLFAFLFFNGLGLGCLTILMIQHLSGGLWGVTIRRLLEAGTRLLRMSPILFLPIAFGQAKLFEWARPEVVAEDPILQHKAVYLNQPFFLGRAVFYFFAWLVFVHFLNKWSAEHDETRDPKLASRMEAISGGGLVMLGLTVTFMSVDWAMSLSPHWFSTIYGVLFILGQVLSAMALMIVVVAALADHHPLDRIMTATTIHDLGKLLLAFVMLWAYVAFSQFLIVWSGNLPEEIPWYLTRMHGGWQWVALALLLFHFIFPFLMLLSRDLKRNARTLGALGLAMLGMRLVDLFWLVGPDLRAHGGHGGGFELHVLDLSVPLAMGGLWTLGFLHQLRSRPLLPLGAPEVREVLREVSA